MPSPEELAAHLYTLENPDGSPFLWPQVEESPPLKSPNAIPNSPALYVVVRDEERVFPPPESPGVPYEEASAAAGHLPQAGSQLEIRRISGGLPHLRRGIETPASLYFFLISRLLAVLQLGDTKFEDLQPELQNVIRQVYEAIILVCLRKGGDPLFDARDSDNI